MLVPSYALRIGDRLYESQVERVVVSRGMAPEVSVLRAFLPYRGDLAAAPGDPVSLELDGGEGGATVFSGEVARLRHSEGGVEVVGGDASFALSRLRPGFTAEGQGTAAIVRDLCAAAGAGVGDTSGADGAAFPAYAADPWQTGWEHVARLAAWAGAEAFVDGDGAVVFRVRPEPMAEVAIRHGREVLSYSDRECQAPPAGLGVAGEGPGGDRAPALRFTAKAGPGGPIRYAPALRDPDAVTAAAQARAARLAGNARRVDLLTILLPRVGPGTVLQVQDLPVDLPDLLVTRVEHSLSAEGARSRIRGRQVPSPDLFAGLVSAIGSLL